MAAESGRHHGAHVELDAVHDQAASEHLRIAAKGRHPELVADHRTRQPFVERCPSDSRPRFEQIEIFRRHQHRSRLDLLAIQDQRRRPWLPGGRPFQRRQFVAHRSEGRVGRRAHPHRPSIERALEADREELLGVADEAGRAQQRAVHEAEHRAVETDAGGQRQNCRREQRSRGREAPDDREEIGSHDFEVWHKSIDASSAGSSQLSGRPRGPAAG